MHAKIISILSRYISKLRKIYLSLYILILTVSALYASSFEMGYASWYGGKFHGRRTASGEIFDTNRLTAAHKTLPFGTIVRVTNIANGKFTFVRINDRGPFVPGRIIDLSKAAAEEIGMLGTGIALVRLDIVARGRNTDILSIQIGAFKVKKNAENLKKNLEKYEFPVVLRYANNGVVRVVIENILKQDLKNTLKKLSELGFGKPLVIHENIKK